MGTDGPLELRRDEPPDRRRLSAPSTQARLLLALAVVGPLSVLYILVCLLLLPWRVLRIKAGNHYGKLVGPTVFGLAGVDVQVERRERMSALRPALFVSNHTSTADMWVGMWLCPFGGCGVAKKEIVRIPFFGQAYMVSGHLLLDRGNRERAISSMAGAADVVRTHRLSLWMWPEGTRSRDGRLKPLKKGFAHLAIATGLPVVPIVLHSAHRRWPGGTFEIVPGPLRVEILDPIDTSDWTSETVDEHVQEVWRAFHDALDESQRPPPDP